MPFDPSWLNYIPDRAGLERLQDEEVLSGFESASHGALTSQELDALSWVFRVAQESDHLYRMTSTVPWLDRIAVGFFDPETDGIEPGFGLIAYSSIDPRLISGPEEDPRLLGEELGLEMEGVFLPAVVRLGRRVPQATMTQPSTAQTTSWARSTRLNLEGWLVPFHAVQPITSTVFFADGSSGQVVENWGQCIDALLVNSSTPPTGRSATACLTPAPSTSVTVEDQNGRVHSHAIVDVDVNLGVVKHHLFPVRFSYDWTTSAQGDSGALVAADPGDEPVGMHQGAVSLLDDNSNPINRAYGLCLFQLETHGGLEVLL